MRSEKECYLRRERGHSPDGHDLQEAPEIVGGTHRAVSGSSAPGDIACRGRLSIRFVVSAVTVPELIDLRTKTRSASCARTTSGETVVGAPIRDSFSRASHASSIQTHLACSSTRPLWCSLQTNGSHARQPTRSPMARTLDCHCLVPLLCGGLPIIRPGPGRPNRLSWTDCPDRSRAQGSGGRPYSV